MKKQRIISFANHKGGVGKTTTAVNVGTILSRKGYSVLLIDLDPQANLTYSLVADDREFDYSIYDALIGKIQTLPKLSISENLDLVPSTLELSKAEFELPSFMARERILSKLIENEEKEHDFIFIDCPPSLGIFTQNALAASNGVIVPMTAEVLPFNGLDSIISFIDLVRSSLNREAVLTGVLITRWESTNTTASIEKGLRDSLESLVFRTKIRKNIRVAEAPLMKQDIATYDPKSNGAQDYLAFTEELLEGLEK